MHDWMSRAACLGADPEEFFDLQGSNEVSARVIRRYCEDCPVRPECLEFALGSEDWPGGYVFGIFGGMTGNERRRIIQARRRNAVRL